MKATKLSSSTKNKRPLLELRSVSKLYQLDGVAMNALWPTNLVVNTRDYISIKGPSGSGKSTLMHLIGLLDVPTSGQIILHGRHTANLSEVELASLRNRNIGFVFQQFNLLPKTPAWQNAALPLVYAGVPLPERQARAIALLKQLGLADRLHHYPNQLSGGQQQRVAIARALINHPQIILADEPTGNLDTASGSSIMNILDRLNQDGKTIILVTHEEKVAAHASRHIKITDGKIKENGYT